MKALFLFGAAMLALGFLRLAAEPKPRRRCPLCNDVATDDPLNSGVYCDRHEGWYRLAGATRREA